MSAYACYVVVVCPGGGVAQSVRHLHCARWRSNYPDALQHPICASPISGSPQESASPLHPSPPPPQESPAGISHASHKPPQPTGTARSGAWHRARYLRRYLNALRRARSGDTINVMLGDERIDFIAWVDQYINQLDPLHDKLRQPDMAPDPPTTA